MYFSFDKPDSLIAYVVDNGLLPDSDEPTVERPGEGNMNFVARVRSGRKSVILKQSRPWVEKYPSIEAPEHRILTEIAFYEAVSDVPRLQERMPRLIHSDPRRFVAVFEDLGDASDYTTLYARGRSGSGSGSGSGPGDDSLAGFDSDLGALLRWLAALHEQKIESDGPRISNRDMRTLNHAHIFSIPLKPDNGLDLEGITPGLARSAARLQSDRAFVDAVSEFGDVYLSDGDTLLHGDFYPGSWVRGTNGPNVIDPEFGFHGRSEFDIGVCRAHLLLSGVAPSDVDTSFDNHLPPHETDQALVDGFTGTEIMRRLIGVAQLPLERTLTEKEALLSLARKLVLGRGF